MLWFGMIIIGLTGGLGAGKTTIARLFQDCGAHIIDADLLAREVVKPGKIAWKDIHAHFGDGVLQPDKSLNRQALARIVFQDPQQLKILQDMLHPRIAREQTRQMKTISKSSPSAVIIYDAALLLEAGAHHRMNHVIVVKADRATQIARVCRRDGLTKTEALRRMRQQMPLRQKLQFADTVLDGAWPRSRLRPVVQSLYRTYQQEARQRNRP